MTVIAPGMEIGILGGGQLGRMLALAAARLGLKAHIYCPEDESPAAQVAHAVTIADYDDRAMLDKFADAVALVTYEFENIPLATVKRLAQRVPLWPGIDALGVAQDRLREKRFLQSIGIETAPFAAVGNMADLTAAADVIGLPAVLKTRTLGYDGKGQFMLRDGAQCDEAWRAIGEAPAILEGFIGFEREVSVIVARAISGDLACYDVAENEHRNHILDLSTVPAAIDRATADQAQTIAKAIATALNYVGVLAVEMFVCPGGRLIVNEIAPRVHNSGHWTIDACLVSQFEQHIRAICGWPLGAAQRHSDARMRNLIGEDANDWATLIGNRTAALHLYGKGAARPGRKMGHMTEIFPLGTLSAER